MKTAAHNTRTRLPWAKRAIGGTRTPGGFTLIEVLVALTICAVALIAALRATSTMTSNSEQLRLRTLAQWSAENRLAQIRIQNELPGVGRRTFECPQAGVALRCVEDVATMPEPTFRRVEVQVQDATGYVLARLIAFPSRLP
jgi:general secretion pathway protein I